MQAEQLQLVSMTGNIEYKDKTKNMGTHGNQTLKKSKKENNVIEDSTEFKISIIDPSFSR